MANAEEYHSPLKVLRCGGLCWVLIHRGFGYYTLEDRRPKPYKVVQTEWIAPKAEERDEQKSDGKDEGVS